VLLAHNAAPFLQAVVAGWIAYLNGRGRDFEVILVDDGSTDGTGDQAETLAQSQPRLRVLRHPQPRGEGAALRTGIAAARYPLLFYTLCDPHYQPADLGRLLDRRNPPQSTEREIDQVHLASGYRAGVPVPAAWRLLGGVWRLFCRILLAYAPDRLPGWLGWRRHLGQLLVRTFFGVRYQDVTCPFRLVRREIFARIPIQSDGSFAHVEILAKANFLGHVFAEKELPLPVGHHPPLDAARAAGCPDRVVAEAWHLFQHPDFGPPVVPQGASPPSPGAKTVPTNASQT
jgi:glycosyltransferase involved in cell wall biosynthesis